MLRNDETWHRLLNWTAGPTASERLAQQILVSDGYKQVDPTHPLGGPDGIKDAICSRNGERWVLGVYFPHRKQPFTAISEKFKHDLKGVASNNAKGMAFVTNQEISDGERKALEKLASPTPVDIFHLERVTTIVDSPPMKGVRKQFLNIDYDEPTTVNLGGQGGKAPGAGGGGGAAIGSGATGGAGGPGGNLTFGGGPAQAPGAGGGGAGAVGHATMGGEGGGGGECVEETISTSELRMAGWDGKIETEVGEGGHGGETDGESGGDTIARFRRYDGQVLKEIKTRGGKGGKTGRGDGRSG